MREFPFASLLLIVLIASPIFAQNCPFITVEAPSQTNEFTVLARARLNVGNTNETRKFYWKVSLGRIISGQGSDQIAIDTTDVAGQTIEITVAVLGVSTICSTMATTKIGIIRDP